MRNPKFKKFQEQLLHGGASRYYVLRAIEELQDHFEDLEEEARNSGKTRRESRLEATERLGSLDSIAKEFLSRPETMSWGHRHPVLSSGVRVLGDVAEIPGIPILLCIENGHLIVRWVAAFLVGSGAAFALLYLLQLLIAIG